VNPLALLLGLVPVLLFLAALTLLDSYKLVRIPQVLRTVGVGMLCALAALGFNLFALRTLGVSDELLRRLLGPAVEEIIKAVYVVWLIRRARVGFMVDAGIRGFAIGAGFALVENLWYAATLENASPLLWLIRGLGTAVMHGCVTAIVAIVSKDLTDRHHSTSPVWFVPGVLIAIAVHALFNQFVLHPLLNTALMLAATPLLLVAVFDRSEKHTRDWLGNGMDDDAELLEMILEDQIENTPVGRYLDTIKHRFEPAVVVDMLCLLRIHLELSLRAKGLLLARKSGFDVPVDDNTRANLVEMRHLEKSIGPTGQLALHPLRHISARELWSVYVLEKAG
jgi:RsiW-degrading membrane proteinase PrsW (M82 family)